VLGRRAGPGIDGDDLRDQIAVIAQDHASWPPTAQAGHAGLMAALMAAGGRYAELYSLQASQYDQAGRAGRAGAPGQPTGCLTYGVRVASGGHRAGVPPVESRPPDREQYFNDPARR
jgi:hypothetical protein